MGSVSQRNEPDSVAPVERLWIIQGKKNPFDEKLVALSVEFWTDCESDERMDELITELLPDTAMDKVRWDKAAKEAHAVINEWRKNSPKAASLPQYAINELWEIIQGRMFDVIKSEAK